MKTPHLFKLTVILTVLAAGSTLARHNDCEGPLDSGRWYLMPKIGAAPAIFANRGFVQRISPLGGNFTGQNAITCQSLLGGSFPVLVEANKGNILQQETNGMPKFDQIFHNGVLHVGFEAGRNVCDNVQMYLEFTYDRATGKCYSETPNIISSPDGCNAKCTTNPTLLTTPHEIIINVANYTAYGLFVGTRYFLSTTLLCDRVSPWIGFKTGLLHRKAIDICATVPEFVDSVPGVGSYTFPAFNNFSGTAFCKSNSVAGGVSLGFDYCYSSCLSILFGFEVIASCPLKSNANIALPLGETPVPIGSAPALPNEFFHKPTNVIAGSTGTLVQFPIWAGFRWEFDFCKSAC